MSSNIDNMNYANDARNRKAPEQTVWVEQPDGSDKEVELPTTWAVCSVCNGEGKHVNPSIDCGGISAEEFHDDPDFHDAYMDGVYDITCNRCHGRTTERVIDYDGMSEELQEAYDAQCEAEAECHAEHMAELRMGC